jgi:hypothetical protein
MTHHYPIPSKQLQIYQALLGRMNFSKEESSTYQRDLKGFIGEKIFAKMIRRDLAIPHLALHSLNYKDKGNHFQPDCMLLIPDKLHLLEIKNYEGEFIYQGDYLHCYTNGKDYRDPLDQLKRGNLYLQNMLDFLNIPLRIQIHVIFVNPSFTLFQAERNPQIILPSQLKNYFYCLNKVRGHLPGVYHTYRKKLLAQHNPDSPFTKVPNFSYERLRKGILCRDCRSEMQRQGYRFSCKACFYTEWIDSSMLRMLLEFHLLFPDNEIKTSIINNWCGEMISRSTIKRIFEHYLTPINRGRGTHYLFP